MDAPELQHGGPHLTYIDTCDLAHREREASCEVAQVAAGKQAGQMCSCSQDNSRRTGLGI